MKIKLASLILLIPVTVLAQQAELTPPKGRQIYKMESQQQDQAIMRNTLASDGAVIEFYTHGNPKSPALIISPAFTGSAKLYAEKFGKVLSDYYVVVIQLRGHGKGGGCTFRDINYCSNQQGPNDGQYSGFGLARLATDIADTKKFLGLKRFAMMGHSMGMNVLYQYMQDYGTTEIAGLFINDESPKNLGVSPAENSLFPPDLASFPISKFIDMQNSFAPLFNNKEGYVNLQKNVRVSLGGSADSNPVYNPKTKSPAFLMTQEGWNEWAPFAYQMNGKVFSMMFWNCIVGDYTGVMPIIRNGNFPVLVYGGKSSLVPWKAMQWVHDQLPGSELMLFEEGVGVHAAFMNPPPSGTVFMNRFRNFLDVKVRPNF